MSERNTCKECGHVWVCEGMSCPECGSFDFELQLDWAGPDEKKELPSTLFGLPITWTGTNPLEGKEEAIVLGTLDGYIVPVRIQVAIDADELTLKARSMGENRLLATIFWELEEDSPSCGGS